MNERIKQLEQMCWEELGEEECYYPVFNTKKFAELIVQECSQMVVNSHPDDLPFVGGKMLVHFGVEE
jgi:hypothetical protein